MQAETQPEDGGASPALSAKAQRAEARRMWWLDRFPGNPLVHLLVFSRWFRLVALAIILVPVLAALMLPRMWTTSPSGFTPAVKVSVVDLVQAWALRRSAARLAAEGSDEEAAQAWRLALGNNRADLELVRGCLRHAVQSKALRPAAMGQTLPLIPWLLQLSGSNRTDVALAARVCERFDLPEQALALLKLNPPETLTREEEAVDLKSLFRTGRIQEFATRWEKAGPRFEGDAEMELYRAAYLAGWGPPGEMTPAAERLADAAKTPAQELLASRLQLVVAAKRLDADGYEQALGRLERAQADRLSERLGYWRLLASLGRKTRARELAEAHVARVGSAWDVAQLAKGYLALDLADRARAVLDRYASEYGDAENEAAVELWMVYARLLADARDWTTLEQLAVRLRALKRAGRAFNGLSYLFEGRSQVAQGLHDEAAATLARAAEASFPSPEIGLQAGRHLLELGYPEVALRVLAKLEPALGRDAAYWMAVFEATYGVRQDAAALAEAARQAYEAQPDNVVFMSNYAAALLINRRQVDEALKLTLTVIGRIPDSLVAHVNHAFALLLNQRFDEAEAKLRRIDPAALDEQQRTYYHLALAEVYFGRRQFPLARREIELIQPKHLFPLQRERVEQLQAQMAATVERQD